MAKLQVHSSSDEAHFQHRASPGRPADCNQNWLGAKPGMTGDECFATPQPNRCVTVVLGLNLEHRVRLQALEQYPSFNLRLHDVRVYRVAEVCVGLKHIHRIVRALMQGHPALDVSRLKKKQPFIWRREFRHRQASQQAGSEKRSGIQGGQQRNRRESRPGRGGQFGSLLACYELGFFQIPLSCISRICGFITFSRYSACFIGSRLR